MILMVEKLVMNMETQMVGLGLEILRVVNLVENLEFHLVDMIVDLMFDRMVLVMDDLKVHQLVDKIFDSKFEL
jgi:hypothetical protein